MNIRTGNNVVFEIIGIDSSYDNLMASILL